MFCVGCGAGGSGLGMVFIGLGVGCEVLFAVVTVPDGVLDNLVVVLGVPGSISSSLGNTIVAVILGNSHCVGFAEYTKEFWLVPVCQWVEFALHLATCVAVNSLGLVVRDAFITP